MKFSETLEKEWTLNGLTKAKFSSNKNLPLSDGQLISHLMGYFDRGALFEIFCILYVDDGAFVFKSRHQLETGTHLLLRHFEKFGLEMHIGKIFFFKNIMCILPHTRVLYLAHPPKLRQQHHNILLHYY